MKRIKLIHIIGMWWTLAVLTACGETVGQAEKADCLPPIYPDYIGVTIPAGFAPLNFAMADGRAERMDVTVSGSRGGSLHIQGRWADFDVKKWHALTEANRGGTLTVKVCAKDRQGRWTEYKDFDIRISEHPLDDYGLTYRRIRPGYEVGGNIGMYQRDLHSFDERAMMTETAVPGRCFNCHTPNRTNPETFTLQVRGTGGGTLVQKDGQQTWYNTRTDTTRTAGSYAYWHPDGRYCAYAVNSVHQSFFVGRDRNLEVYHKFSDVVVLDTETDELILAPQLRTKQGLEIFPAFSADGRTLYFSTSDECDVPAEYEKVKCSLCAIGFDAETGTFGERVDTLLNGPATDKSYVLARPSYDGQWLMYCTAERSNFPVSQKESDLWLMNLTDGTTRPMDEVNSNECESWHNWSGNSRWFVFSSKREDGMTSLAYIAGIDDEGKATKPVLLPQRDPMKHYRENFDSYNCPDFTLTKVDFDVKKARKEIFSGKRKQVTIRKEK